MIKFLNTKKARKAKNHNGFMIIEVLIAASIITVAVLAAMAVAQKSVYISRQSFHATQAAFLLEEGAEAVRIVRDNAWSRVSTNGTYYPTFSGGTWTLPGTGDAVGIFTRTVTIESVSRDSFSKDIVNSGGTEDTKTKLITVTVSWSEGGNAITKTLQFYIMDIFS